MIGVAVLIFTMVGMWFALQADIEEAKQSVRDLLAEHEAANP